MFNEKKIINYSTSGLGNRLRPLASCYSISKKSGRKLCAYWDTITPNGCLAEFSELFTNHLDTISMEDMRELEDCLLISEGDNPDAHGFKREEEKFGRTILKELAQKYPYRNYNSFSYDDQNKNIIIYHNNFLPTVSKDDADEFILALKPVKEIQIKVDHYIGELGLNKQIIGVHARGSDFGFPVEHYIDAIESIIEKNISQK